MKQGLIAILLTVTLCPGWTIALAGEQKPTPEQVQFFETRIRPLLVKRCLGCHGPAKQKSNLRLDSAEGLRKGGASGDALISSAQPEMSLLVRVIQHGDHAPKCLPGRNSPPGKSPI